jgi:hypothetical protein
VELIFVSGSSTEYTDGYLEEVNDRGIVLRVEGHGEYPARPLFFPWNAVIQISEASDGWGRLLVPLSHSQQRVLQGDDCGHLVLFDAETVGIRGEWARGRDL